MDALLPYFPDVLAVPSRAIATLILAAFIAPLATARTLASRAIIYTSWASIAAYIIWFSITTYMHTKHILVPVAESSSLGSLWHGIRE